MTVLWNSFSPSLWLERRRTQLLSMMDQEWGAASGCIPALATHVPYERKVSWRTCYTSIWRKILTGLCSKLMFPEVICRETCSPNSTSQASLCSCCFPYHHVAFSICTGLRTMCHTVSKLQSLHPSLEGAGPNVKWWCFSRMLGMTPMNLRVFQQVGC